MTKQIRMTLTVRNSVKWQDLSKAMEEMLGADLIAMHIEPPQVLRDVPKGQLSLIDRVAEANGVIRWRNGRGEAT